MARPAFVLGAVAVGGLRLAGLMLKAVGWHILMSGMFISGVAQELTSISLAPTHETRLPSNPL